MDGTAQVPHVEASGGAPTTYPNESISAVAPRLPSITVKGLSCSRCQIPAERRCLAALVDTDANRIKSHRPRHREEPSNVCQTNRDELGEIDEDDSSKKLSTPVLTWGSADSLTPARTPVWSSGLEGRRFKSFPATNHGGSGTQVPDPPSFSVTGDCGACDRRLSDIYQTRRREGPAEIGLSSRHDACEARLTSDRFSDLSSRSSASEM